MPLALGVAALPVEWVATARPVSRIVEVQAPQRPRFAALRGSCRIHETPPNSDRARLRRRGRRRAFADELEVDVLAVAVDVPQQPAVAVDTVEARIDLENDARADGHQAQQRRPRRPREALAGAQLRRVDLQQPHASAVASVNVSPS